ncbi:hypothetical protein HCN44_011205 [Aphidius gifuensis]|uniref:G-patch domain-containing protein n=1 Tax=Aphidius gifuensis TaxID=684658 RepID=A0A834XXG8_APHGI|nr:integrator complex subunit 3 homolog [Aphidius gifuensis]KAF7993936.1 hypothetical protein HCN44_011205 [Aphidius gifuensis]
MAYRGIKCSDPFVSKTSRNERFAQMSKQEQIIQQKKLEIQAKMEEIKAKQAVESVKKTSTTSNTTTDTTMTTTSTTIISDTSTTSKINSPSKKEDEKPNSSVSTVNLFANDGSFLDQFKKISNKTPNKQDSLLIQSNDDEKKDDSNKNDKSYDNSRDRRWNGSNEKSRDWENRRDRRRSESRWSRNSERCRSSSSSPSPPPPPPSRHRSSMNNESRRNNNYHHSSNSHSRNQYNNTTSCQSQNSNQTPSSSMMSRIPPPQQSPIIHQLTSVPPPNMRNISTNISPIQNHLLPPRDNDNNYSGIDNHGGNTRMSLPPPPLPLMMVRPPPPPPLPPSSIRALPPNTNIPPPGLNISGQQQQHHQQRPTPAPCNIQSISGIQPPNIPPPPTTTTTILPPMSQMPPNMLPIVNPMMMNVQSLNVHNVSSTINNVPPPNLNIPPPSTIIMQTVPPPSVPTQQPVTSAHLLPTTYPTIPQNQLQLSNTTSNIIPSIVRINSNISSTPDHSGHSCPVEAEQLARIVADCGDAIEQEVREKNAHDPKLWFLHQKQSAAYQQYRGLVGKFRDEKNECDNIKKGSGAELYCPEDALSDTDDYDKSTNNNSSQNDNSREESREERKRKRRSRWSEPDNKISVSEIINIPTNIPPPVLSRPVIPTSQCHGIVMPKIQNTKGKNPMLTKVSRGDPALLNYARQTYGTLDLSDEQWKKAEDHYKINLLYQNLLKKREEVKRLEAQGKHKYEYDSDEETEGGTWEHKLRSAEMEATQLWADELTVQSEGKHHIGDFLPPDELKKFMEQYSALKQGKEPDLSDYKEYKLKEDNIGFQMLQKLGWSEGQGLGSEGSGRIEPINKATSRLDSAGLGSERPDGISRDDDEFDAYRKRMMLAYRFRPNPLNNPRRPYY